MFWTYRWRLNSGETVRSNMKWLCGFAVSHVVTHYCAVTSHRVAWSVRRSFCRSVSVSHKSALQKTAETIKLPFALRTRVGLMKQVLHEFQIPTWKGQFWGGNRQTSVNYRETPRSSVQRRLNRSRFRLGCGLESITCYMGGPDSPWEGALLVDRGAHCKL